MMPRRLLKWGDAAARDRRSRAFISQEISNSFCLSGNITKNQYCTDGSSFASLMGALNQQWFVRPIAGNRSAWFANSMICPEQALSRQIIEWQAGFSLIMLKTKQEVSPGPYFGVQHKVPSATLFMISTCIRYP